MVNPIITNIDLGSIILKGGVFEDGLLTLAGADDIAEGTILARDSVSLKFVLYVIGGVAQENGIPKAILTYDASIAGAGDLAIRAATAGEFRAERLIVDADGDASNITAAILDQMRDYGLISTTVSELNELDNQ